MQALAGVTDECREALFNVEMHIFEVKRPLECTGFDFADDLRHAAIDVGEVRCGNDALARQHFGMGQ